MNELLMQSVLDAITFFALSDDDAVNQDTAVEQLEHLGASLKRLSASDRSTFRAFVAEQAHRAKAAGQVERAEFLHGLPDQLGLTE